MAKAEGSEAIRWQIGEKVVFVIRHRRHGTTGQNDCSGFFHNVAKVFTWVEECVSDLDLAVFVSAEEEAAFSRRVHQDGKEALEELQCVTFVRVDFAGFGRFVCGINVIFDFVG